MFAVAQFRKVSIGALFVISDIVALEEWDEHLHSDDTQQSIIQTFIIAIDTLREWINFLYKMNWHIGFQ